MYKNWYLPNGHLLLLQLYRYPLFCKKVQSHQWHYYFNRQESIVCVNFWGLEFSHHCQNRSSTVSNHMILLSNWHRRFWRLTVQEIFISMNQMCHLQSEVPDETKWSQDQYSLPSTVTAPLVAFSKKWGPITPPDHNEHLILTRLECVGFSWIIFEFSSPQKRQFCLLK